MKKQIINLALFAFLLGIFTQNAFAQASGSKPELFMYRHNGSLGNSPGSAVAGNIIGTIKWNALTAINGIRTGATIQSTAIAVAPNFLMANLKFSTSGPAGLTERAIITETGLMGVGIMTPQFHLDVAGNTHTSGNFYGRIHFDVAASTDLPSTYIDEAYFERKSRAQLGLAPNPYSNGGILSLAPGGGGLNRQLFSGGDDGLWTRSQDASGADAWAAWEKILTSGDINGRPNLVARFLPPGPSSSQLSDGQIFDNGNQVVIGGIPAAPAVPAPAFNAGDRLTVKGNTMLEGNVHSAGNAQIDGNTTVNGITQTGSLTVAGAANANSLQVANNAAINGSFGIGKAPTAFDLDVAGESNFDSRVKIGASNFPTDANYVLAVGGGVIAEEVLVQLEGAWADYVFAPAYELRSLEEVATYVAREKHLPGIVSAQEVAKNGLNLGEMQKAQMEKIEELFLHVIALNREVRALKADNEALKAQVAAQK